jgi:ABC-type multidrug transport system permease subunit
MYTIHCIANILLLVYMSLLLLLLLFSLVDSFSAVQLCQVLKKVANAGASVLFTIHQPSSEIFNSFDHLILLNKGRVMYQGEVSGVPDYFAARARPNPPNFNPADWIMNVAQSVPFDTLDAEGFFLQDPRDVGDAFTPEEGKDALGITITRRSILPGASSSSSSKAAGAVVVKPPGFFTQINLLFTREINNLSRDVAAVGARFGLTSVMSLLIGTIFLNVGETDSSVPINLQSHFGALIMVLMMSMFGTAQPALLSFPSERPVFLREYSTDHYTVVSYFMSRLTIEASLTAVQMLIQSVITYFMIGFQADFVIFYLSTYALAMASTALAVFLGCSVEDPKMAQELLPLLFVPQMLFAGFFVAPHLMPSWLSWARYICSLTYGVRILMVAEFQDCDPSNPQANDMCNGLLSNVDADPDETWWNWLVLCGLFVVFRLAALVVLRRKATKFF